MLLRRISLRLSVRAHFLPPLLCLGLAVFPTAAFAHDSPEHSIEELTAHIEKQGETAPLLLLRAGHYRVTDQAQLAIADLRRILELQSTHQGAMVELSRIHLTLGRPKDALQWVQQAMKMSEPARIDAHLFAVRAEAYIATGSLKQAQQDLDNAIAGVRTQIDWYLDRSRVHELLGLHHERIAGLREGYESTRSAVLFGDWVEALIDGGRAKDALREIEPRLAASRLQSTWLLRRARAHLTLGGAEYSARAQQDLQAAIAEMNIRLRPSRPDIDLLLDRAHAFFLLGERGAAENDFALAQQRGATPRQLERVQRVLAKEE